MQIAPQVDAADPQYVRKPLSDTGNPGIEGSRDLYKRALYGRVEIGLSIREWSRNAVRAAETMGMVVRMWNHQPCDSRAQMGAAVTRNRDRRKASPEQGAGSRVPPKVLDTFVREIKYLVVALLWFGVRVAAWITVATKSHQQRVRGLGSSSDWARNSAVGIEWSSLFV